MIKAIFFDLHKVITHGEFHDIYEKFANRVNISVDVVSDYHKANLGGLVSGTETSEDMLIAFSLSDKMTVEEMLEIWKEEIVHQRMAQWARYVTPFAEAWWKERGCGVKWPDDNSKPMQVFKLQTA